MQAQAFDKKFLYLVQCDGTKLVYSDRNGKSSDILYLSWKVKNDQMIYLPSSTWTEGRNILFQAAQEIDLQYEYYIFIDDDIRFTRGGFDEFEDFLLKLRPAIATPFFSAFPNNSDPKAPWHTVSFWDPCMNAFHRSVFRNQIVLPYITKFDKSSWWYSGYIALLLANLFYRKSIIQINEIVISNDESRPYPRNWYLGYEEMSKMLRLIEENRQVYPKYLFKRLDEWLFSKLFKMHPLVKKTRKDVRHRKVYYKANLRDDYLIPEVVIRMYVRPGFLRWLSKSKH